MSLSSPEQWFAAVAISVFLLMMAFPVSIWRRCGKDAHRLLKNDPTFGFFVPLVFPLAMATLARTATGTFDGNSRALGILFGAFAALAVMLTIADMKIGPLEPYMLRENTALDYDTAMRGKIHTLFRRIHMDELDENEQQSAAGELAALQRTAMTEYGELARGFASWSDFRKRGSRTAWAQVFVNLAVAVGVAALFAWVILAVYDSLGTKTPAPTANATIIAIGLLMLWFPLRLYSEWYTGFYTFRSLREYWTFWFLAVVGVVGLLLSAILLRPDVLPIALSTFGSALLVVFGVLAKLKPRTLGYAAVVFEEMPLIPFVATMVLGIFVVLLTIVIAVTSS
jgi:hypothetical protein